MLRHTLLMSRHKFLSNVLLLLRQKCLVSRHQTCLHPASHGLVLLESVATNNCFSAWKLCRDRAQDFFKPLAIFCHNKKLFSHDRLLFSGSCHLLNSFSQHRIICCDKQLPWPFSSLLQFLSWPTFLLSRQNFIIP